MISDEVLRKVVWCIHSKHELAGCVIGYYGDNMCRTIAYPSCVTPNSENIAVIIEEVVILQASGGSSSAPPPAPAPKAFVTNRSKIGAELIGAGASCTFAAVSGLGVIGAGAAEVPSAGLSTFLLVAAWGGFVTGAIQCGNGVIRVGAALSDLDGTTLDRWDDNEYYAGAMLIVDGIGVATAVVALPFAIREMWKFFSNLRAFNAMKLTFERLQAMNRLERMRTITKVFKDAARSGEDTVALVRAAKAAQVGAKTMQAGREGLSVRQANTLRKIIQEHTITRIKQELFDVFMGAAGIGLSATPARWTGSGSGSVNTVIHLMDAGQPNLAAGQ
jgi:hypothetical protein